MPPAGRPKRTRASRGAAASRGGPGRTAHRAAAVARARAAAKPKTRTPSAPQPRALARLTERPRPRFTSRAAVLVLILAVLAVSYASSLRAYLQQRSEISDLQDDIAKRSQAIKDLQKEKSQWSDDAFIEQRARLLGFVHPGETPYVATRNGIPIESGTSLSDPTPNTVPPPWWVDAWETFEIAGDPPTEVDPEPARKIEDPEGAPQSD